jgi:hypothetical protein
LQQLPTTPDRLAQAIDLHLALDEALFPLGAYHRSCDVLREAERLAIALGDQRQLGWVTEALSTALRRIGAYDQAVALAQRAMALAMALGDGALQGWSALRLGQTYYFLGDYQRASDCFREVIASLLEHGKVSEAVLLPAHGRSWLVYCLAECGEFSVGLALGTEAVRLAEAGDFPTSRCAAYASLGYLSLVKGAFRPAIAFLEQGLELCRQWYNLACIPECAASWGLAYALAGHLDDALPLLEQAVGQEAMMGGGYGALRITELSQGYLLAGRSAGSQVPGSRESGKPGTVTPYPAWPRLPYGLVACGLAPAWPGQYHAVQLGDSVTRNGSPCLPYSLSGRRRSSGRGGCARPFPGSDALS